VTPPIDRRRVEPSGGPLAGLTVWAVLRAVATAIRRRPRHVVPFTVAGLVVGLADWIRTVDPIPMQVPNSFRETVNVQFSLVPMGTSRTVRAVGALVDLRLPYLLGAVGLELLVLIAVGAGGYLTLQRALDVETGRTAALRYGVVLALVGFLPQWLGTPRVTLSNLLVGLVTIVLFSVLAVRLFLLPGLIVAGQSYRTALRQSQRRSYGIGWTVFGLVVVLGLGSWGLAQIPVAGGFLSTAIVAPAHAFSLAALVRHTGGASPPAADRPDTTAR